MKNSTPKSSTVSSGGDYKGLSIASFVLGISAIVALLIFIAAAAMTFNGSAEDPIRSMKEILGNNPSFVFLTMFLSIVIAFSPLVGEILGIVALSKRAERRALAITGVAINSIFIALMIAGYLY